MRHLFWKTKVDGSHCIWYLNAPPGCYPRCSSIHPFLPPLLSHQSASCYPLISPHPRLTSPRNTALSNFICGAFVEKMSPRYRSWLWFWSCLLSLSVLTHALELEELFEFGEEAGDQQLKPGSDSTAELPLNGSLYFFGDTFDKVYVSPTPRRLCV